MRFQRLSTFLLAALPLLATAARAQTPPWTPLGPFGGVVDSITADPATPGVLYATTPRGAYKTTDPGTSWTAIHLNAMPGGRVAVDPLHPATLYLTGSYQDAPVLKSVDGGAHWSPAAAGLPLYYPSILAVDPARPRRLYVGTNSFGFWRSEDAGASWQEADAGLPGGQHVGVLSIAPASRPAGTVLVATTHGVFRSADGGVSWSAAAGLPGALTGAVAFAPSDPRTAYASQAAGLYRSTDGGVSWRRVQKTAFYASEISVSPKDPRLLYLRIDRALFRSTDGGGHLVQIEADVPVTAVAADPFAAAAVWSAVRPGTTTGGVWRSANQGKSWAQRSQGLTGIATTSLAIDPENPERLWTNTSYGPYHSNNGGARWARTRIPTVESGVSFLTAAAGAGSRIFGVTFKSPSSFPALPSYTLWKTDDDGASWTRLLGPLRYISLMRVAPSAPTTAYVFLPMRLYRSTDNGASWTFLQSSSNLLDCEVGDLAVSPSNPSILYLGGSGSGPFFCKIPSPAEFVRSEDGGASWTNGSAGLPSDTVASIAVDPRDPHTVYISFEHNYSSDSAGVWKSTDGGASWNHFWNGPEGGYVAALLTSLPGRVYAATVNRLDSRVFRSDDGGVTWEDRSAGLKVTGISGLVTDPVDPRRIYAVTANGVWVLNEAD